MTLPFDELERRAAARLEHGYSRWLIIWGCHSRLYWAFPRSQAPPGTIIAAQDAAELTTRIQHAELSARAHMPPPASPGGDDSA
jgi:hypothetical protein